jgi:hypothetical protein
MPERLSSLHTFVHRAILPPLLIGVFGVLMVMLFRQPAEEAVLPGTAAKALFALNWVAGSAYLLRSTRRLRTVFLLSDALLVSNLGRERRIPLDCVVGVRETRFWNPKLIKVRVEEVPGRRETIVFLAPFELQVPFSDHSVVVRLKSRVEAAYARALPLAGASLPHPLPHRSER